MQLSEKQFIAAPRDEVYAALNNAEILRQCIPGCEELTKKSESEMAAKITLKIGPIKASFAGEVTLSNFNPPQGYTISGQGSGSAGGAKGSADVTLQEEDGGTLLSYAVDVQINGKIAQLGSRLIDTTAKKLSAQFFEKFAACLAPEPQDDATGDSNDGGDNSGGATAAGENKARGGNKKLSTASVTAAAVTVVLAAAAVLLLLR